MTVDHINRIRVLSCSSILVTLPCWRIMKLTYRCLGFELIRCNKSIVYTINHTPPLCTKSLDMHSSIENFKMKSLLVTQHH